MNGRQSNQRSRSPRYFVAAESLARLFVPMGIFAILFVPVAAIFPPAAFAAFGACVSGFAIFQIVRWVNRRDDSGSQVRHGGRDF